MQVLFHDMSPIDHISAGRLRALAVTGATRLEALPEIPTVGAFVSGYEASAWFGVGAPKGTPDEIIDKLNKAIDAAFDDDKIKSHPGCAIRARRDGR